MSALQTAQARILELEAKAARAEGLVEGLRKALEINDLAAKVVALTTERDTLKAKVEALQVELSGALIRAQQPAVLPGWRSTEGNNR